MIKQLFNNKEIRFIEKNNEYWAIATDVAKVLGFREMHLMLLIFTRTCERYPQR